MRKKVDWVLHDSLGLRRATIEKVSREQARCRASVRPKGYISIHIPSGS